MNKRLFDTKRFEELPLRVRASLVWPECSLDEGVRRIEVADAFNRKYPDGLPDDFGKQSRPVPRNGHLCVLLERRL